MGKTIGSQAAKATFYFPLRVKYQTQMRRLKSPLLLYSAESLKTVQSPLRA